jgi:hypothetical protein
MGTVTVLRQAGGRSRVGRTIIRAGGVAGTVLLGYVLVTGVRSARNTSGVVDTHSHLAQIALAVANYHERYGSLPPAYVAGPDGTPWHSWRVLILPYLDHMDVYRAYRFDEPWNGPNNAKLADQVRSIYQRSGLDAATRRTTSFVAVVGPETAWPGAKSLRHGDVEDGIENTLLVVEVPDGDIPWMAPIDLRFDRMSFRINDGKRRGIGSRLGGARVAAVNGSRHNLPDGLDPRLLRALLTANGHEAIDWDVVLKPD